MKNSTNFKHILINLTKSDHIQTYSEISFHIHTRQKIYYFLKYLYQAVWDYYDLESLRKQKRESTSSGPTKLSFLHHQITFKAIISVCLKNFPLLNLSNNYQFDLIYKLDFLITLALRDFKQNSYEQAPNGL